MVGKPYYDEGVEKAAEYEREEILAEKENNLAPAK